MHKNGSRCLYLQSVVGTLVLAVGLVCRLKNKSTNNAISSTIFAVI
jgi:hypothetical protein